ncbi:P-loop containing nucleoside triphosphate hydrolase protein [Cristinia sonorae]|uniref:RNA helicase n=1 Tax=Cristinia sonorae TaxID=1940300 RepID=A0A8K0XL83_9AGAR|nr:P-loop containing nucleoside triphosphate hydrolase protein [Cristinia sonorae]
MEAFHLLTRGGTNFNKKKFERDVQLFNQSSKATAKGGASHQDHSELPPELDFFKYAQGGQPKRKGESSEGPKAKKQKLKESQDEGGSDNDQDSPAMGRQRVTAKGTNVPEPAETFRSLESRYELSSLLLGNLEKSGYHQPTGIQAHGIPILLEGRDLVAISPTGTGKTLSYLLPIISALSAPSSSSKQDTGCGVRALVLAPTRELAHQIHNECLKLAQGRKWKIMLFSKATANNLNDKNVRDKVDIVISTPLRLVAAMQSGSVELSNVRHLVLDEADRMLDAEFLSQVQEVIAGCSHPNVQKAVFSATLPAGAEQIAMGMLDNPIRLVVGLKDTPLPLIAQSLTYVADDASKVPTLLQYLSQPYNPPVLIFVSTQDRATSLAEELIINGTRNVDYLHAGMTKKERDDAVSRMRQGQSWVMICTEVMARGMDFKGVREVINYDFPQSVQSYVHRVGRTGRMGREGKAVTFFTNEDGPFLKTIANVILQSGSTVPEWILKLPKPSKMKRKEMGKVKRPETVQEARRVGRSDAIKKRDIITGSKRRKEKEKKPVSVFSNEAHEDSEGDVSS